MATKKVPQWLQGLRDYLLSTAVPDDASYVVIIQRDGDSTPSVVTNLDTQADAAKALRDTARGLSGDA